MAAHPATGRAETGAAAPGALRRLYLGWLELAGRFGEVQSVLIVCVVYLFVMGPMAVAAAVSGRDLLAKRGFASGASAWWDADSVSKPDLERAKRLF
jgi:hypothetical protein